MTFFPTLLFELTTFCLFIITSAFALKRHGKNVFILFAIIIGVAFYIELNAISNRGYDYLDFLFYADNTYPFILPFGWVVFFYWAHTLSEGLIAWDGTFLRACTLALTTGVLTGSMSLFLEPGGQALGWWIYYSDGIWGISLLDVPFEIYVTYFVWGAVDGFIFRISLWYGFIQRRDFNVPILTFIPSTCSIIFFTIMAVAVYLKTPQLTFMWLCNVIIFPVISTLRQYEYEFKEKGRPLSWGISNVS